MPYGRNEFAAVATDLASRGFAVWNIEYRRLGAPGGGWPGTFQDVALAIDHLATMKADGIQLDLSRVTVVGHSAGGHLALWAARNKSPELWGPIRVQPTAAVGLAAVTDLVQAAMLNLGRGAVTELLGGSATQYPDRYAASSPMQMLPLGIKQLIIHGTEDDALPIDLSRRYAAAAQAVGDSVQFVELPDAGHMDFLDPHSQAHSVLCDFLR
jgi:acetyl esterase/lipase